MTVLFRISDINFNMPGFLDELCKAKMVNALSCKPFRASDFHNLKT